MQAPDPMSRLIPILLVVGGASEIGLLLMKRSGSPLDVAYYVQVVSIALMAAGVALLALVLRASRGTFRSTTALMIIGFASQLAYLIVRYYYEHLATPAYLPTVSVADLFFLLSYVVWASAAIPHLSSYYGRMQRSSKALLSICAVAVVAAAYFSGSYWHRTAVDAGYDSMATIATLVHAVVPFLMLLPLAWVVLLYHVDHRGKKLLEVAYLYFMIPVGLIAIAEAVTESSYVWSSGSMPGQYSDAIYLLGVSTLIASAASVSRSALRDLARGPSGLNSEKDSSEGH